MKKIIAITLSLLMLFSLAACSTGNAPSGSNDEEKNVVINGSSNADRYENKFVGISCQPGSEWTFMTDEQIRQNNETAMGMMGGDYAEAIKNASTFTDMMATHSNGMDTLNVTFEKLTGANAALTEQAYANASKETMKGALESMGISNLEVSIDTISFAGKNHVSMSISGEAYGVPMFEKLVILKCDNYMVIVTACSWNTNICDDILNFFKAL